MSATPSRPAGVRLLNATGAAARALGLPLLRLDADRLCSRAAHATGLEDFGDDGFRVPLRILVDALEREAGLTTLGRLIAREDLGRLLENRLRITDALRRHPEILDAPVRRPLFILGLPRTGTSILHELLTQDPANRVPMTWEVHRAWPPPERATYETDPRIAEVARNLANVDRIVPGFKRMHPMGAQLPQECVAITAHEFASMLWPTTHHVPSYQHWLDGAELQPVYAAHRRWLQYLQWRCPAERWVLKSPGHLWALDALLAEYPDALVVQTHRDPLEVIASLASLVAHLRTMSSDAIDPHAIGAEWTVRLAQGLEHTMAVRAQGLLPADRVFDVQFRGFVGDEISTVRRMYEHFGWTLSPEAEARMRRFLADNAADKHGRHQYTLAAAGLDPATERRRYATYQARHCPSA